MRSKNWFGWLHKEDLHWAIKYLTTKRFIVPNYPPNTPLEKYINHFNGDMINHLHDDARELLVRKMRAARSQKNNRNTFKSNQKKAYSFMMDVGIQDKLKELAGGRRINDTLEDLINDAELFKKAIKDQLTESIKPPKSRNSSLTPANQDEQKIKKLKLIKKAQELVLRNLLRDLCRYEFIVEKIKFELIISTEDSHHINAKYEERKELIRNEINDQLGLLKFSLQDQIDVFGDSIVKIVDVE